jgi:hypothetical protein
MIIICVEINFVENWGLYMWHGKASYPKQFVFVVVAPEL